jgi:hypothetical protein
MLNAGFDMIQFDYRRDLSRIPFYAGAKNVIRNIGDPITPINHYGWWNFLKDQVIPISVDRSNAQYWPNYTLHLVGGGMTYVATKEWYESNNFPEPALFSIVTMAAYHFVNEVVENGSYQGDNVDPIADIYLFDIGGIVLFSFDNVNRFFAEDLNLADWSPQPSFSLRRSELHNNGQFFSIKWKFPFSENWHLFYYFGTNGVGGLSYKYQDGSALSVGVGLAASDLITLNQGTNKKTMNLVWRLGVFYDINNSLLTSLTISRKTDYMVNLNVYPGIIKIGNFSPGLWLAYDKEKNVIGGITAMWAPFGIGYSAR